MENAETPVRSSRPRPWLLVALGLAIVAFVATWFWPTSSAVPGAPTSNQPRTRGRQGAHAVDPAELNVRLDALNTARPEPGDVERNPFRFQPKAPPPPPPNAGRSGGGAAPAGPPPAPPLPTVPPIPLKFIGIVERAGVGKVAALSDCRVSYYGREGDVIDGRYRIVRIGVESIVIEYVNGTGRTTIRLSGDCPPR